MLKKLLLASACCLSLAVSANDYVGQWHTVNEKTNEVESLVSIYMEDNQLKGRIEQIADPESRDKLCDECTGEFKNQKIEGMTFIWGLTKDGDKYDDGKILDPASGKIYSASLSLIDGGEKLKVRGYLGFALLGRTQVWLKAN
ncbi:signal peptide protein [Endozoicomonas montiporae]|uniref:Signal peptide protein n=2 Tax=Endozoicomonas montiporae TaxID=1027273 RepID=A0A081N565_9GAMM|nr:DUF2147 domain-containing protein [Endozoicomonas montiporae]AMO57532.1 hypothetical protein EZMO1_3551 [Endozoicomonas montiporae CL-33]KEQ13588.1 signal peptide protein [Endozoicomonas montiporae]